MALFNIDATIKNIFMIGRKLVRVGFRTNSGVAEYQNYNDTWREIGVYKETNGLNGGQNINLDIFPTLKGSSCSWQYLIKRDTHVRAGMIMSCWNGGTCQFNEIGTSDLGDTSNIRFEVQSDGTDVKLVIYNDGIDDGWSVKVKRSII